MLSSHSTFNSSTDPRIAKNTVHVWCTSLAQPAEVVQQLSTMLSEDEQDRSRRFQFEHLRRSFIVARGTLRIVLARYLNRNPKELRFGYTNNGKPYLSDPSDPKGISFNLSHSNDLVLYAITTGRQVGIDIEHVRPMPDLMHIARNTFSEAENTQLKAVIEHRKLDAFFNGWTRKEAFIKAIGDGVSFPLDQFDVALKPNEPARLLSIRGSKEAAACWSLFAWQPAEDYVAALVVEGNGCSVTYREWNYVERVQRTQESR